MIYLFYLAFVNYYALDFGENESIWGEKNKVNILVVGLDRGSSDYAFVDSASVLVLDKDESSLGIFSIDPDLRFVSVDGKEISIKRSFNLDLGGDAGIDNVIRGIEEILAINIDRHMVLDAQSFMKIERLIGSVEVEVAQDLVEPDIKDNGKSYFLKNGERKLKGERLLNALRSDENGPNARLSVHTQAIRDYVSKLNTFGILIRVIPNLQSFESVETDFSKSDLVQAYYFLWRLNSSSIRVGYTQQSSSVLVNSNYGQEKKPLIENIDRDVQSIFLDSLILREQARVEVLNATEKPGYATKFARLFENTGIIVVRSDNSPKETEETTLFVKNGMEEAFPRTIEEIVNSFDGKVKVVNQEYKYKHVGDLILVIGEDAIK